MSRDPHGAGRTGPACNAPFTSMHLDPRGEVRACCRNEYQRLGNLGEQPLTEIWNGAATERLRRHLGRDEYSLGCEQCGVEVREVGRDVAYPHVFDHLGPLDAQPEWPRQLELALSSRCNLRCIMCNGELSSAIRHREGRPALPTVYDDDFFDALDLFLPHLTSVVFLGGEPFLGNEQLRVMERLVELDLAPRCHVTTNGTVWNPRVERLVRRLPMHVAVSIDGATAATNESIRIGTRHATVMETIDRIRQSTGPAGWSISHCLMRTNWHELPALLLEADRWDVDVFVNTVTHPPSLSLLRCSNEEVQHILASRMSVTDAVSASLGRNRPVWERHLAWLASISETRLGRGVQGDIDAAVTPVTLSKSPNRSERGLLRTHAGAPTSSACIHVDAAQIIRSVDEPDGGLPSIEADLLMGRPLWDVPRVLRDVYGETLSTDARFDRDGTEEREMVFRTGDGTRHTVRATMVPAIDGGQVWHLAVEVDPGR